MLNEIIVPYIRIPPVIDMIIAAIAITPQWKSITGKAADSR